MPFDPGTAQLVSSSGGFDPSTAKLASEMTPQSTNSSQPIQASTPTQSTAQEPGMLSKIANSGVVNKINALGGGVQQTLANSIGYAGGLIGDVTGNKNITQGAQLLSKDLQPPQFVQKSMESNPNTAIAGNAVGGAMAMGTTGLIARAALPEAAASYAANGIIGAATSGEGLENRALGAVAGLGLTKVGNVVGEVGNKLIGKAAIPDMLKNVVSNVNAPLKGQSSDQAALTSVHNMWTVASKIRDSLYNDFKEIPGDVSAKNLSIQAANVSKDLSDVMTPGQKGAFNTLARQAENIKNLDDLHEYSKSFNDLKSLFLKSGTAPDVTKAFNDLKASSSDFLTAQAEKLGAADKLQLAQKYNKDVIAPLQDFGADQIAKGEVSADGFLSKYIKNPTTNNPAGSPESLGKLLNAMDENGRQVVTSSLVNRIYQSINVGADGVNPAKGVKGLQDYINLYGQQLGPDGTNMLKGMQKVLKEADIVQSSASKQTIGLAKQLVLPAVGASLGLGHGYTQGGTGQALAEGAAGALAPELVTKMMNSETGQMALKWAGEHKLGATMIKDMLSNISTAGLGNAINKLSN